jgi:hypothetical protein
MLNYIISVGRTLVVLAAVVTLLSGAIFGGYLWQTWSGLNPAVGAIFGTFVALIVVAVWLGPIAALYLIATDVRRLATQN